MGWIIGGGIVLIVLVVLALILASIGDYGR